MDNISYVASRDSTVELSRVTVTSILETSLQTIAESRTTTALSFSFLLLVFSVLNFFISIMPSRSYAQDFAPNLPVVLGSMRPDEAIERLRAVGETSRAAAMEKDLKSGQVGLGGGFFGLGGPPQPYDYTTHAFGYIRSNLTADRRVAILQAGAIGADKSLRKSRITVTLDALRVAKYPGSGEHQILFDFAAQNDTTAGKSESVHFNQTFRAKDEGSVAVIGYPIFIGLNVGNEGLAFSAATINVKSSGDDAIVSFFDSDVFKQGLQLTTGIQPALGPLTNITVGLWKWLLKRKENLGVQSFTMGLDFSAVVTRARLREGSYIAVQVPDSGLDWNEWYYDPGSNHIRKRSDNSVIPYNYIILGVSRYQKE
jgi:hypothetical protein